MEKTTHDHVVAMPKAFIVLRGFQLLLGFLILILSGWLIAHTSTLIDFPDAYGLTIFTAIATLIILVYFIVSSLLVQAIYNMWAFLALEIFMVIFWLCSMATLAALRSSFVIPYSGPVIYKRARVAGRNHLNVLTGTAVVSAFELILFIISLVIFTIKLVNHRKNDPNAINTEGGHNMQSVPQAQLITQPGAPVPQQPQYGQQQPQYGQQPPAQGQPQYQQQYPPAPQGQYPPQQQYQQPQGAYAPPVQSEQEKMVAEAPGHHGQPQYQQQPISAPAYNTITPVSSPPPQLH